MLLSFIYLIIIFLNWIADMCILPVCGGMLFETTALPELYFRRDNLNVNRKALAGRNRELPLVLNLEGLNRNSCVGSLHSYLCAFLVSYCHLGRRVGRRLQCFIPFYTVRESLLQTISWGSLWIEDILYWELKLCTARRGRLYTEIRVVLRSTYEMRYI